MTSSSPTLCFLKPCYTDPRDFLACSHSYYHLVNIVATSSQGTQDRLS